MYLKRLELAGFKSFAEKTELEFVQGISAVVGPNGSGKSNISDSIRWVLGEQSARSLRGGKMEDIIFAGSDSRKAVNFGEVSLTLDNTDQQLSLDYSEVTVTRRLHRSGESEYFINKQACRLRDITELFMDTGIGKEAYSIIGQGRIEEILSTRSEDRRGIFEEASGIVKYKSRKKEAEKKLDDTEQNLIRIHDLIAEIEDQIEPLREQAEKAATFKQLKEQLKQNEISVYVHQIEEIHQSWKDAEQRLEELKLRQAELAAVVSRHDVQLEGQRTYIRNLEEELEQLQQQLLTCSEELEKSEGHREVLKEREKNLHQQLDSRQEKWDRDQHHQTEREQELAELRQKRDQLKDRVQELETTIEAEAKRLQGIAGEVTEDHEDRLKTELLETLNEAAQLRNELRYLDQQNESAGKQAAKLTEEYEKSAEQEKRLAQELADTERKQQELVSRLNETREGYQSLAAQLEEKQKLLEEALLAERKWEQQLDAMQSRRDTMKEMQNDFDGFQHGVKEVLKARERGNGLRGVHGAVAELVQVPARLEKAVETALGGALQHIVMEDEAAARTAIGFLKSRQLGRATFLPLNVIRGRFIQHQERSKLSGIEGFVGIAVDLVDYEDTYDSIVSSLLGQVVIAETLEQANRIAAGCQYRYRVVTLDGDVVNAGGSMTGGSSQRKSANLLGRHRQIEELDEKMAEMSAQLQALNSKVGAMRTFMHEGKQKLEALREEGESLRLQEQQWNSEMKRVQAEKESVAMQLQIARQELELNRTESGELTGRRQHLEEKLKEAEQQEQHLHHQIKQAEEARKSNLSVKEQLQSTLTDLKIEAASLTKEQQGYDEQLKKLASSMKELSREMEEGQQFQHHIEQSLQEMITRISGQIEQINQLRIQKADIGEKLEYKRAERIKTIQELELKESDTKEQRAELKQVEQHMHQTEVKVNRLDVELENLLKKLAEEYELSFELAKQRYPLPEDVQAAQNLVRELKRQISALGDVNLGAIEEHQRISERFAFLSDQQQDLVEAKQQLYGVIQELEKEMSQRFRTTFDQIRVHFVDVFSKLFGGGRADLILEDPDHLLNTGIEIVAQPPGKKLQNLQLLSGGEKALTAIALLFAILNVKPVPFCVLDEVEAALDEANVARFAQYLRTFSEMTQFIVVTHRKGTMEEADVLYGVTMEEGGVSKLVSVRLDEEEAQVSA
ncbi:chromosome segregation protein SMC [Marinicrinis sediminis]|uniref:Chromosome partition protein Smc n=1 Tax=Marinicrinis sediminis TaxID=1652465 RepID=A0ABW5R5A2_9BACL